MSALHRRYSDISHRFRAGWTFHQFLQSLGKSLLQRLEDRYSADFQDLYAGLKEISQNLNASESDRIRGRLDGMDRRLSELMDALEAEDSRVTPDLLRQFFRRIKSYDEKILTQLVKFYLYVQGSDTWQPDRLDKVDFLLARLSEEEDDQRGEPTLGDYRRLAEIFQRLLGAARTCRRPARRCCASAAPPSTTSAPRCSAREGLEQLNENALIRRFRDLKHDLGSLYFQPDLLLAIQDTNLALKNRIQKLYRQEEQRIVAEYQRVFELEREVPVDGELDVELGEFREEIERFEKKLQREEFKLEDIAQIRQRVRELLPRLTAGRPEPARRPGGGPARGPADVTSSGEYLICRRRHGRAEHARGEGGPPRRALPPAGQRPARDQSWSCSPERVVLLPEIFPLRLEPREVVAYRRCFGRKECDRRAGAVSCWSPRRCGCA